MSKKCNPDEYLWFAGDYGVGSACKHYFSVRKEDFTNIQSIFLKNQSVYEVLPPDQHIRPYFDLEIYSEYTQEEREVLVAKFCDWLSIEVEADFGFKPEYIKLDSSNDEKLSYHLIIKNMKVESTKELKNWILHLWNKLKKSDLNELKWVYKETDERLIFDKLPYGKNQCFRSVNQGKSNSSRVLKTTTPIMDTFVRPVDFCNSISVNLDKFIKEPEKNKKLKIHNNIQKLADDMDQKTSAYWCEFQEYYNMNLFHNYILKGDWDQWRDMGFAIFNTFGNKGYELFNNVSKINVSKYDEQETEKTYNSFKDCHIKNRITFQSIRSWASKADKNTASKIYKMFIAKTEERIYANNDREAADAVMDKLEGSLLSCEGRIFYKLNQLWICDMEKIRSALITYITNLPMYKMTKDNELDIWKNFSSAEKVFKTICCSMTESNFDKKLFHSTTKYRLCFQNGVLDMRTKKFHTWENIDFDYYPMVMIPYDYKEVEYDVSLIDKVFEPLFGNDTNKFLQSLSRSVAGCVEDKNFITYLGNRNCGKGILFELLKCLGGYTKSFNIQSILEDKKNGVLSSKDLYWLLDFEFSRLIVSQEAPKDCTLRSDLCKKIMSGGDDIVARRNYDRTDTHFTLELSMLMFANEYINKQGDVSEHCLEFEGCTSFISSQQLNEMKKTMHPESLKKFRIADPDIKRLCGTKEYHLKMISILLHHYNEEAVKVILTEVPDAEDVFPIEDFLENYKLTLNKDDMILGSDIHEQYGKKIRKELKSLGVEYKKCTKSGGYRNKWVYSGIVPKYIDLGEDD
jgi:hypothetical protein